MPWFITAICSKETMERIAEQAKNPKYTPLRNHTFGFYNSYNEAYEAVSQNRGSMCECLYDYIVLEYIECGIHPMVHAEEWFVWDQHNRMWNYIGVNRPKEFDFVCNWALG